MKFRADKILSDISMKFAKYLMLVLTILTSVLACLNSLTGVWPKTIQNTPSPLPIEKEVALGAYPFVVSIELNDVIFFPLCIGSIIGPSIVITAAECLHPDISSIVPHLFVIAGTNYLNPNVSTNQVIRSVSNAVSHPRYQYGDLRFNVALVYVDEPFIFDESFLVSAIKLSDEEFKEGDVCEYLAWSMHTKWDFNSKNIPLKVMSNRIYGQFSCYFIFNQRIWEDLMCSEKLTVYGSPCFLDVGSPVVCNSRLYGIALKSGNCSNPYQPNIFVSLSHYYNFITDDDARFTIDTAVRKTILSWSPIFYTGGIFSLDYR